MDNYSLYYNVKLIFNLPLQFMEPVGQVLVVLYWYSLRHRSFYIVPFRMVINTHPTISNAIIKSHILPLLPVIFIKQKCL